MLKTLDISGFKSFADKNRIEFSNGLTLIVGPNGSGKSNIVDSIKWVLGEKSIKSLRGKDSSDVIFNGSSTRKALNTAEVSLTFDNTDKRLNFDAPEVVVTRRVFRSGEGSAESEYFLNRQPCKLKDIRELLLGTGLGTHAYSIIEQGRVDSLLQSSPRERRVLFEEAAGVSRFKAKRLEALNALGRIDQALLRHSDLLDEVEKNLNKVKTQAEKALQFRSLSERLEKLRFQAAAMDYTNFQTKLQNAEKRIGELINEQTEAQKKLDETDALIKNFEQSNSEVDALIETLSDRIASNRHSIGVSESVVAFQTKRMDELESEINSAQLRITEMRRRMRLLRDSRKNRQEELDQAQTQFTEVTENLQKAKNDLDKAIGELDELRSQKEKLSVQSFEILRNISTMENVISSLTLQNGTTLQQLEQNNSHLHSIQQDVALLKNRQEESKRQQTELEARRKRFSEDLEEARREQEMSERLWNDAKQHLMELHRRHSAMLGRISTLEELQERHEGLSPGVRYLLTEARRCADGPFRDISGLVADLIQVEVDAAALIEIALGERAQYLVVEPNSKLLDALRRNSRGFPGRVGFIWMEDFLSPEHGGNSQSSASRFSHVQITNGLENLPGVLGRADQFIQCQDIYLPLFKYLLGETWIVENLNVAIELSRGIYSGKLPLPIFPAIDFSEKTSAANTPAENVSSGGAIRAMSTASGILLPQIHFVTLAGERYSSDGILCIGPQHASSNLISRRSELRTLGAQLSILSNEISDADNEVQKSQQELEDRQQTVDSLEDLLTETKQKLIEHQQNIISTAERQAQQETRIQEFTDKGTEIQKRLETLTLQLNTHNQEKNELEKQSESLKKSMESLDLQIVQSDAFRSEKNKAVTECKVELAKSEERLGGFSDSLSQIDNDIADREKIISELQDQLEQNHSLFQDAERITLGNNARLANYYLEQENLTRRVTKLRREKDSSHLERSEVNNDATNLRKKIRGIEDKIHALKLEKGAFEHDAENVVARLCEDYGILPEDFLKNLESLTDEEKKENSSLHTEIQKLRARIQNLGNINPEALNELDEIQERYQKLAERYEEFTSAKDKLTKTIERISADCRKIFMQTFDRIGEYFFHIFRDLFGGGNAELQFTECEDPLEGGIEIIAQPPGKQRLNLSLMSGGEKTMTCVALLFALFKNHPSQFCILDEVDAALDEANTSRLAEILEQFRDQTQFIIISHSKKTMSIGDTIYGITMQDSGVSKPISVRFEEVNDEGELESLGVRLFPSNAENIDSQAG